MDSFFVGLASGSACLSFCGPAIMPYFLYRDEGTKTNYIYLLQFFAGRLIGYMLFGVLAWYVGKLFLLTNTYKSVFMGLAYMLISLILVVEFFIGKKRCAAKTLARAKEKNDYGALVLGLATGINLCPSFLLIFTDAVNTASIFDSIRVFALFFIGTSLYFLPLPLVGLIKQNEVLKMISKFLINIIAAIYFYRGAVMFLN